VDHVCIRHFGHGKLPLRHRPFPSVAKLVVASALCNVNNHIRSLQIQTHDIHTYAHTQ
jgi:hypothetical protein